VGIFRLAWLPDDETLLRVEAGVSALQPMVEDDAMVGFEPPKLTSLRCDMMKKSGELDSINRPFRDTDEVTSTEQKHDEPIPSSSSGKEEREEHDASSTAHETRNPKSDLLRDSLSL
jgi:hypothetical protein